jgi:hypothetical protein
MLDVYDSSPSEPEDWIKFLEIEQGRVGKFKFPWLDEFSEHENRNGEPRSMGIANCIGIYAQLDEELELVLQASLAELICTDSFCAHVECVPMPHQRWNDDKRLSRENPYEHPDYRKLVRGMTKFLTKIAGSLNDHYLPTLFIANTCEDTPALGCIKDMLS